MEKDVGKIRKNDTTEIVVRIDDFGGRKGLTIREFTTSDRYTGFTKSGTRIPEESFNDFKAIINQIDEKDFDSMESPSQETSSKPTKKQSKQKHLEVSSEENEDKGIQEEVL